MKYDYSVIGAGVSGMSAAIILAQRGYRTALIESAATTGPTIRGFTRRGVFFDTGFHYTGALGRGELLDRLFRYIGISGKIVRVPFDSDGFDLFRCLNPSFEFSVPYGLENLRARLIDAFPREGNAIAEYLQFILNAYQGLPFFNLDREMTSSLLPFRLHEESLAEVLDRLTANALLRSVLSMHCLLHGVLPEEVPITNHACVVGPYYESAHGISGGGRRLAEAFDERLQETGVDVYCGSRTQKILVSDAGQVTGIRLEDGSTIECWGCIATAHPASLLEMVPDRALRPAYRETLGRLEDTSSAVILFGLCREPLEIIRHSNLFAFPTTQTTLGAREGIIEGSPLYITGTRTTGTQNSGAGAFTAICPAPNLKDAFWSQYPTHDSASGYDRFKEEITRRLRAYIEEVIPEFRHNILFAECATPYTLMKWTNNPTGSLYGVKHKIGHLNPMPLTKIENLYLAGQAVTGPGILGAMVSAFLACGYVLGHERLRKELREWT